MTACCVCHGPVDPDVTHTRHEDWNPWCPEGCDCPEVCANCCSEPDCPTAPQIPGQPAIDEATGGAAVGYHRAGFDMTDTSTSEAAMAAALRPFGWTCGPEFWRMYHRDPWVFNLANAVERLHATVEAQATELADAYKEPTVVSCNCYPLPGDHDDDCPLSQGGDLSQCDYYNGVGTCTFGCWDEPHCQTSRPREGWPLEVARTELADAHAVIRRLDDFIQAYMPHFIDHGFVDRDDLAALDTSNQDIWSVGEIAQIGQAHIQDGDHGA